MTNTKIPQKQLWMTVRSESKKQGRVKLCIEAIKRMCGERVLTAIEGGQLNKIQAIEDQQDNLENSKCQEKQQEERQTNETGSTIPTPISPAKQTTPQLHIQISSFTETTDIQQHPNHHFRSEQKQIFLELFGEEQQQQQCQQVLENESFEPHQQFEQGEEQFGENPTAVESQKGSNNQKPNENINNNNKNKDQVILLSSDQEIEEGEQPFTQQTLPPILNNSESIAINSQISTISSTTTYHSGNIQQRSNNQEINQKNIQRSQMNGGIYKQQQLRQQYQQQQQKQLQQIRNNQVEQRPRHKPIIQEEIKQLHAFPEVQAHLSAIEAYLRQKQFHLPLNNTLVSYFRNNISETSEFLKYFVEIIGYFEKVSMTKSYIQDKEGNYIVILKTQPMIFETDDVPTVTKSKGATVDQAYYLLLLRIIQNKFQLLETMQQVYQHLSKLYQEEGNVVPSFFKPNKQNVKKTLALVNKRQQNQELDSMFNDIESMADDNNQPLNDNCNRKENQQRVQQYQNNTNQIDYNRNRNHSNNSNPSNNNNYNQNQLNLNHQVNYGNYNSYNNNSNNCNYNKSNNNSNPDFSKNGKVKQKLLEMQMRNQQQLQCQLLYRQSMRQYPVSNDLPIKKKPQISNTLPNARQNQQEEEPDYNQLVKNLAIMKQNMNSEYFGPTKVEYMENQERQRNNNSQKERKKQIEYVILDD